MIKLTEEERIILLLIKENGLTMLTLRSLMRRAKEKQIPSRTVKVIVSELAKKGLIDTLELHGEIYYDISEYGAYLAKDTRYRKLPSRDNSMTEDVDFLVSIS